VNAICFLGEKSQKNIPILHLLHLKQHPCRFPFLQRHPVLGIPCGAVLIKALFFLRQTARTGTAAGHGSWKRRYAHCASKAYFPDHRGQISVHQGQSLGSLCGEMMPLARNLPKRVLCLADTPSKPAGTAQSGVDERTGISA